MRYLTQRERLVDLLDQMNKKPSFSEEDKVDVELRIEELDAERTLNVVRLQRMLYRSWRPHGSMVILVPRKLTVKVAAESPYPPTSADLDAMRIEERACSARDAYYRAGKLARLLVEAKEQNP